MENQVRKDHPRNKDASLTEEERDAIVRLIRSPGIGPARFFQLYDHYGSACEALVYFKEATRSLKKVSLSSKRDVDEERHRHEKLGAHLITFKDPAYPPLLKKTPGFPPVLSVLGSLTVLQREMIAIVGSRNASLNGRQFVQYVGAELASLGFVVVSGFARGVDTVAHESSLDGGTVGVLAGGVDIIYPEENHQLYKKIQERGCFVSEMPLGVQPQGRHFPRRNRLISGMALGLVVCEARLQSGSMVTADYALEQGREVFAVPGSPLDPRSMGSHLLLKQGAHLVARVEDILEGLESPVSCKKTTPLVAEKKHGGKAQDLLDLLSGDPLSRHVLLDKLGWAPETFNQLCVQLEMEQKIVSLPGGLVSLCLKVK